MLGEARTNQLLGSPGALAAVRPGMDAIETKPQRTQIDIDPFRGELQVLPASDSLELNEGERQRIEIVLNSITITGFALSVGAVWWAARAAGLLASVLSSTPAWRHVDPLPVLGRTEQDEEDPDPKDEDQEKKDEERRARWVFGERAARS